MLQDLRYRTRILLRAPWFSAVAVLTLSLCIGANTALFGVIHAVLFRPLPYERAGELYALCPTYQGDRREFTSMADFTDCRARSRAFAHLAAIRGDHAAMTTPAARVCDTACPRSIAVAGGRDRRPASRQATRNEARERGSVCMFASWRTRRSCTGTCEGTPHRGCR